MPKGHLEKWVRAGHSQEIYCRIFAPRLHRTIRWMGEYANQYSPSLAMRLKICAAQSLANGKDPTLLSMKTRLCDETFIRLLTDLTISSFRMTAKKDFHLVSRKLKFMFFKYLSSYCSLFSTYPNFFFLLRCINQCLILKFSPLTGAPPPPILNLLWSSLYFCGPPMVHHSLLTF